MCTESYVELFSVVKPNITSYFWCYQRLVNRVWLGLAKLYE